MGYIRHDAMVITGYDSHILAAYEEALEQFVVIEDELLAASYTLLVSRLTEGLSNGYKSFCIFPDGSKEGWEISNNAGDARHKYMKWLRDEGEVDWVWIFFGGDEPHYASIEGHNEDIEDHFHKTYPNEMITDADSQ